MGRGMRRRTFLGYLAVGAVTPFAARAHDAQQGMRRLGVLAVTPGSDSVAQVRLDILTQALAARDWKDGANLRIDWLNAGRDAALIDHHAGELIAARPDVLLAIGTPCAEALRQRTRTIPIVFAVVTDPIAQGIVKSLSHPDGNITGFTDYDGPMAGKWLAMLTEIAPRPSRVTVLYNPATAPFASLMLRTLEGDARSLAVTLRDAPVRDPAAIAAVIASSATEKHAALLVLPDFFTISNRAAILDTAARANMPAVYWNSAFVADGGLMSYGTDNGELVRRAADYIDRILKGEKAGDLPVQNPTKFELSINQRTAKALGITISPTLLATADEVID
jgi:putative tryptophan/tyrosine transport system substrate-binding protein